MTADTTGRGFGNSIVSAATWLARETGLGANDRIAMNSESGHVRTQSDMSGNETSQVYERAHCSSDNAFVLNRRMPRQAIRTLSGHEGGT